jgi:hypothetical protein
MLHDLNLNAVTAVVTAPAQAKRQTPLVERVEVVFAMLQSTEYICDNYTAQRTRKQWQNVCWFSVSPRPAGMQRDDGRSGAGDESCKHSKRSELVHLDDSLVLLLLPLISVLLVLQLVPVEKESKSLGRSGTAGQP